MNRTKAALVVCALWLALLWPAGSLLAYRDLETGTFLTRDPAGMVDGPNLYAYVRQNPWTHFDPEGLQEDEVETPAEEAEMMRPMREAGERMEEQARAERERLSPTIPEMRAGGAEGEEQARKEAQSYNKNQELRRQKADADFVRQYMRPWETSDKAGKNPEGKSAKDVSTKSGVEPYEVGTKKELDSKANPNDGLSHDHQPSYGSLVARFKQENGRDPTPEEAKEIYNNGASVAVPTNLHRGSSPTYGGRNNKELQNQDATNPSAAAKRDSQAMVNAAASEHKEAAQRAAQKIQDAASH